MEVLESMKYEISWLVLQSERPYLTNVRHGWVSLFEVIEEKNKKKNRY